MLSPGRSSGETVSVVICDDEKVLTDALEILIERETDLVLAAPSAHDPHTVVQVCHDQHPDVALIDIRYSTGATTGIDATRVIKVASPRTNVVLMTAEPNESVVLEAADAGASAVFDKSAGADVLIEMVRTTGRGHAVLNLARLNGACQTRVAAAHGRPGRA
jgi:two-component system response regulator DesR